MGQSAAPDSEASGPEPSRSEPSGSEPGWVGEVWDVFSQLRLAQLAYVPDAGLAGLIRRAEAGHASSAAWRPKAVPLSSEQEGIGVLAGAWLGGERGVLLMQSSGVGNCINLLSLARTCRFPLLAVVTMRGQWAERNPWQVPMGSTAANALQQGGMLVFEADEADALAPTIAAAGAMVFSGPAAAAVLVHQRVLGAKTFTPAPNGARR